MDRALVDQVRLFHRTVTQRVGALNDAYLSRGRPLGRARVLWEIGTNGEEVRGLRERLDLDSGYLSRMLRALSDDGLVELKPDSTDARVRIAALTRKGRAEVKVLDSRSDDLAAEILRPLNGRQRERLVRAMAEVGRLLTASTVQIDVADPRQPSARFCLESFFDELATRFHAGFDPNRSISADDHEITPPAGALLVATLHGGHAVGCGAVKLHGDAPAELKRMWVSPDVRGLGVGRRLLHELESYAAEHGATRTRLETNRALTEAIVMYQASGYREVDPFSDEPYADHWFEKTLEPAHRKAGNRAQPRAH